MSQDRRWSEARSWAACKKSAHFGRLYGAGTRLATIRRVNRLCHAKDPRMLRPQCARPRMKQRSNGRKRREEGQVGPHAHSVAVAHAARHDLSCHHHGALLLAHELLEQALLAARLVVVPSRCRTPVPMRRRHAADLATRISGRGASRRGRSPVPAGPRPSSAADTPPRPAERRPRASESGVDLPRFLLGACRRCLGPLRGRTCSTPTKLSCGVSSAQLRRTAGASGPLRGTRGPPFSEQRLIALESSQEPYNYIVAAHPRRLGPFTGPSGRGPHPPLPRICSPPPNSN